MYILMPVFRDAPSARAVISAAVVHLHPREVRFVVVDDGTIPPIAAADLVDEGRGPLTLVTLRRNLGHQRAIAVGLAYIAEQPDADAVIVMDADGEDRVEDLPRLIEAWKANGGAAVVFAERTRRLESLRFRVLYQAYRHLHRLLTGIPVRFGNFSLVPRTLLLRLVYCSELWNHYAAAIMRARLPYTSIPTVRGQRLEGRSQMGFVSLVMHGLSALSVFSDTIGVRILVVATAGVGGLTLLGLWAGFRTSGDMLLAIAVLLAGGALMVTACALLTLVVLGRRSAADFIPARDHRLFIEAVNVRDEASR